MSGAISLEAAIRTCKVDTGWANKVESDRFLNPNNMVCPIWNGVDLTGRRVCPDSFYTKRAGCNSAEDRVVVENAQRPQYMEYINLSANGIDGAIYGSMGGSKEMYGNSMPWNEVGDTNDQFNVPLDYESCQKGWKTSCANNVNNLTGNFGKQLSASVYPPCAYVPYSQARQQMCNVDKSQCDAGMSQKLRQQQALQEGFYGNQYRNQSGF